MLPVAISLAGSGIKPITYLFLGWFGPRGLASVLFALLILEQSDIAHKHQVLIVTFLTVALSVVLHGVTAAPFAKMYAEKISVHHHSEEGHVIAHMPYEKFKQTIK
jgi:NhaP-type Na+/H+ or K+/H+ antiporter